MKTKRPARTFLLVILGIVLYFLLFPYPQGRETVARISWTELVSGSGAAQPPGSGTAASTAPFKLGEIFGYVDAEGRLQHAERSLFRVALSESGFVNYTRLGSDWILRDPAGKRVLSFSGNGYPFMSDDGSRIFIVKTDLTGMRELDRSGDLLWNRDFPALMTCASVEGDFMLIGLLNGAMLLLNRQGAPIFEQAPEQGNRTEQGGSRIPVILGCAVPRDGSLLAAVSGIDPQFLSLLQRKGSSYALLERTRLATDFRREVRMAFSPDTRYLAFEGERSAGLFDPRSRRFFWQPLQGAVAGIAFPHEGRFAAFLSKEGMQCELRIVAPFISPISSERFVARDIFVGGIEGQLLLGIDGRLLRVDIETL